jgi:hypothetical protein
MSDAVIKFLPQRGRSGFMNLVVRGFCFLAVLGLAIFSLSCGRNHDLEFIEVVPSTETLTVGCTGPQPTDCGPTTAYTAIGHYIHPQTTQDLTSQVQWSSSTKDIIQFADPSQPNVLFPTGGGCGQNLIVQAVLNQDPSNVKIGTGVVNVTCGTGTTGSGTGGIDFSLIPNPGTENVAAGGTATYTIIVNELSNSPSVQLSVNTNTLPSGISASLAPTQVTAPGVSQLTLTTSATQAANTYTVQVQGTDSSGSTVAQVSLVVQ